MCLIKICLYRNVLHQIILNGNGCQIVVWTRENTLYKNSFCRAIDLLRKQRYIYVLEKFCVLKGIRLEICYQ